MSIAKTNFITIVLYGIEYELDRIMWNIHQEEYDNPFRNSGNVDGFKNDVFEVHAYDWGKDDDAEQSANFKWRDFEIYWYKYLGRGMSVNREITNDELAELYDDCIKSLLDYEAKND